jgi:TRAP-type C4-dicarboxylate transport system permease small subunit
MVERLFRLLARCAEVLAFAGMLLISVSIAVSMVDIVARKTTGWSVLGITDIGQLLVMSCICLAMPFAFVREAHVGVTFVTDPLPPRALSALKLAVALLSCVFLVMLTRFAFAQAWVQIGKGDMSMTLGIPIAWYWASLLTGFTISTAACVLHAVRCALQLLRPDAGA